MKKIVLCIVLLFSLIFISSCITLEDQFILIDGQTVLVSCNSDQDCQLLNTNSFYCCQDGCQDDDDYSKTIIGAVNFNSYVEIRNAYCPTTENCKRPVACGARNPNRPIKHDFEAKCIDNMCKKLPK